MVSGWAHITEQKGGGFYSTNGVHGRMGNEGANPLQDGGAKLRTRTRAAELPKPPGTSYGKLLLLRR